MGGLLKVYLSKQPYFLYIYIEPVIYLCCFLSGPNALLNFFFFVRLVEDQHFCTYLGLWPPLITCSERNNCGKGDVN